VPCHGVLLILDFIHSVTAVCDDLQGRADCWSGQNQAGKLTPSPGVMELACSYLRTIIRKRVDNVPTRQCQNRSDLHLFMVCALRKTTATEAVEAAGGHG
jgi:hypothetical protein